MKKLFDKNELTFALILIAVYVVGSSIMSDVSSAIGTAYSAEMVFNIIFSSIVFLFIKKNGLNEHLRLQKPEVSVKRMLFYIPMIAVPLVGTGISVGAEYAGPVLLCHTIAMFFTGFIEEIIFRGFLFNGIAVKSTKRAVIITSLTFAIGHIVNLLNGYDLADNLIQVVYAVGCGFMLAIVLVRTESIIPCIVFHMLNNMLTAFIADDGTMVMLAVRFAVMIAYTVYIIRAVPAKAEENRQDNVICHE